MHPRGSQDSSVQRTRPDVQGTYAAVRAWCRELVSRHPVPFARTDFKLTDFLVRASATAPHRTRARVCVCERARVRLCACEHTLRVDAPTHARVGAHVHVQTFPRAPTRTRTRSGARAPAARLVRAAGGRAGRERRVGRAGRQCGRRARRLWVARYPRACARACASARAADVCTATGLAPCHGYPPGLAPCPHFGTTACV
jgi:hypothetical protein